MDFLRRQHGSLFSILVTLSQYMPEDLEELSVGDATRFNGGIGQSLTSPIPDFLITSEIVSPVSPALVDLSHHLRRLTITLCFPDLDQPAPSPNAGQSTWDRNWSGLTSLLTSTKNTLEELSLSGEANVASLSLAMLWPRQNLPCLQKLQLRTVEASFEFLSTVIWCHRHSLHTLILDDFNLLSEDWPKVIDFAEKVVPEAALTFGFTWVQDVIQPINWSPGDPAEAEGGPEDDDRESSYSDGSDFELVYRVMGYQEKKDESGQPLWGRDVEYEDLIEVSKVLKDVGDSDDESEDESYEYEAKEGEEECSDSDSNV